jgi:hypothetical protein
MGECHLILGEQVSRDGEAAGEYGWRYQKSMEVVQARFLPQGVSRESLKI